MDNIVISIIVPIYNAEKYLDELFSSIEAQTYRKYEVILINDGSTDNSEEICLKFKKSNSNVKYFYKENSGVSDTRNYGIEKSIGKYLCFVDSDDILDKDYLNDFIKATNLSDAELICCDYNKFYDNSNQNINCSKNDYEKREYVKNEKYDIIYKKYAGYLWNKIFIRKIISENNISFNRRIHMSEDLLFVFKYISCISKVFCFDKKNYYYRISSTSASKNLKNTKWFSIFLTMDELLKRMNEYSNYMKNNVSFFYILYIYEAKYRLKYIDDSEFVMNKKNEIKNRIAISKNLLKYLNLKQKFKVLIFKTLNSTYFKIKKGG